MCGIVYVLRTDGKPAQKTVLKKFAAQRTRGTEGFGFVALDNQMRVGAFRRFQNEKNMRNALSVLPHAHILFHHRYPTSAINVPETAHPILVKHKELRHTYYVVHNGVLSNDDELKDEHEKMGYKYTTEIETMYTAQNTGTVYTGGTEHNDSEALAIELARTIEGKQQSVRARGSIATVVLQLNKAGTRALAVYYGTNGGNPLTIRRESYGLCIASEGGVRITDNVMYRYDLNTHETAQVPVPMIEYQVPRSANQMGYHTTYQKPLLPDANNARDWEYEDMLADLDADIAIARSAGEQDEVQELEAERERLKRERSFRQLNQGSIAW